MGAIFKNSGTLHGKIVKLIRGGKEVSGILLSKNLVEKDPKEFKFKWETETGSSSISDVSEDELENIKKSLEKKIEDKKNEEE